MYTTHIKHSQIINILYKLDVPSSSNNMIDSHEETVNPEVLEQIQKIAAQVETLFEKNPEKHEAVLLSVQNLADSLLQDSSYSRKLYEAIDARQAKRLEKAQTGSQRSEIINFYTKVMT
jgi:hypothetical protein